MSAIFGALGLPDTDVSYLSTLGQTIVYDATLALLGDHNDDVAAALAVFVQETTSDHKRKYKLPGSGQLQRVNRQGRAGAVKAYGSWDIGLPLEDFGARLSADRITLAHMTIQEYNRHLDTVFKQDKNTIRFEMFRALFNNTERTFKDEIWGDLLVEPLANNDAVTYPPVIGSIDDATANHYITSGYVTGSISDTNNPIPAMVSKLESHFGVPTGGSNIVVFINDAETAKISLLGTFEPVPNRFVDYGDNVSLVTEGRFPSMLPGRIIGEADSALISEWRWIPSGYMLAVHMDAPRPLIERIDPPATGLPRGLALVAEDMDYPFRTADWSHRFGFGVGNRLNGVVQQLAVSGTYTIPTLYA